MHPKDNRRRTLKVLGLVGVSLFTLILQSVGTFHVLRYSEERKITGNDRQYSYIADDFPEFFPISTDRQVLMSVEESHSFTIKGKNALTEWSTTEPFPTGSVRLGPENRHFYVSAFHQLHCLRIMRTMLEGPQEIWSDEHMHHCLNYLRQMILCNPDLTLEPADVLQRDFDTQRFGSLHICRDYVTLYDDVKENNLQWQISKVNMTTS